MAIIGALRGVLSLDSAAFEKGAKRAQASMSGLQRSLKRTGDQMSSVGRTMTKRVTAPLAAMAVVAVKTSLSTVDAQAKLAQSMGTTTRSVQVLTRAGDLAGVSMGQIEQATVAMTKRLSQAAAGTGPAVKALDRLNLTAEGLLDMPLDERIAAVQTALKDLVPEAERAGVASQIFGDRAAVMFSRIDADVLAQAASEVDRFGVAVSDVDADKIEAANDAMSALGLVTRGLANQLTVALAPVLQTMAEKAQELADWFNGLSDETKRYIGLGTALAAALGPVSLVLGAVVSGLAAIASPIGLAIVGFAALAAGAGVLVANWDVVQERFPELAAAMEGAVEVVGAALSVVTDAAAGLGTFVLEQLNTAIAGISALMAGDWAGAWAEAEQAVTNLRQAFEDAFTNIDELLGGWPAKMLAAAQEMTTSFSAGLVDMAAQAVAAMKAVWEAIWDEVSSWPGEFVAIGGQIIDGLVEGIKAAPGKVRDALLDVAKDATSSFLEFLGIQSPSRVFAEIGEDLVAGLNMGIEDSGNDFVKALEDLGETGVETMESAFSGVEDVLSGVLDGTIDSWSDALDVMARGFKDWLKDLILTSALNPVTVTGRAATSVLGGAGGIGNTVGAIGAGQGGILGNAGLLGTGGVLGSVYSGAAGLVTSLVGPGGGLGAAGTYLTSVVGSATSSLGAFGAAVGALALPIAGVALLVSGFREKVTVLKSGLQATVEGLDVAYREFERTKRSRFWGLSNEESTRYSSAGSEWDPLREAVEATQTSVVALSKDLGVAKSAFSDVSKQIRFDFHDLNESERLEEVEKQLGKLSDEMATAALESIAKAGQISQAANLGIETWELWAREGETASGVLQRLAGDLGVVNSHLDYMNRTLLDASLAGARAASSLIANFGSRDALSAAVTTYLNLFYSEGERLRLLARDMRQALKPLGKTVPETREDFRDLVDGLDLTKRRGRELYTVLVGNAAAFDALYTSLESGAGAVRTAGLNAFQSTFLGENRQRNILERQLGNILGEFNKKLPATRERFKAWVTGLDRTTERGQRLYEVVLANAAAFDRLYDSAEAVASAVDLPITRMTNILENRIDAITDKIGAWRDVVGTMTEYIRGLRSSGELGLQATADYNNRLYKQVLRNALAGNLTAAGRFTEVADARLESGLATASTAADYNFLYKSTIRDAANLRTEGREEVSELREVRAELTSLRKTLEQLGIKTVAYTGRTARILKVWNKNGLPSNFLEVE